MLKKKAVITGITGQDGGYLADFLLKKGYEVYGFVRRETFENSKLLKNVCEFSNEINFVPVSISDPLSTFKEISKIKPDEFYHLAAHSFVSYEMSDEIYIMNINFNSTSNISTSLREVNPKCKMFFAGSSEMFGIPNETPQNENTRFNPRSIYGISKVASYYLLKNLREQEGFFAATGIMYNHESPRRRHQFVTKKIINEAVKIKLGLSSKLELGNLDALRDWGYAPDYVRAMWLMLQQEKAEDYIVATGKLHSVKEFVAIVFDHLDLDYKKYVKVNKQYYRPAEEIPLCGNSQKIRAIGWAETINFETMIKELILAEEAQVKEVFK